MSAELECGITLVCRAAELSCISSVSLAAPQNQYFLLLGQSGLSEQTSFCCFNIIPLLKIKGGLILQFLSHTEMEIIFTSILLFFKISTDAFTCFAANFQTISLLLPHHISFFYFAVRLLAKTIGTILHFPLFAPTPISKALSRALWEGWLTGTSWKWMLVTLLLGQLCQALLRRKASALVCRPSSAANLRNVQFWTLMGPS